MAGGSAGGLRGPSSMWDPTYLAANGRVYYASDADYDDRVTGQTSAANTTPTFLLNVPSGTTAIPLMMSLCQAGTVAGGAVDVLMVIDNANRYGSSGTAETALCARTDITAAPACTLYSSPTATDAYGVRIMGLTIGQDVSPAEGAVQEIIWTPQAGMDFLVGPAAWLVYTYAASTGPSWYWSFKWAEFPTGQLGQ